MSGSASDRSLSLRETKTRTRSVTHPPRSSRSSSSRTLLRSVRRHRAASVRQSFVTPSSDRKSPTKTVPFGLTWTAMRRLPQPPGIGSSLPSSSSEHCASAGLAFGPNTRSVTMTTSRRTTSRKSFCAIISNFCMALSPFLSELRAFTGAIDYGNFGAKVNMVNEHHDRHLFILSIPLFSIGPLGIGPRLQGPQPCVLPLYYGPVGCFLFLSSCIIFVFESSGRLRAQVPVHVFGIRVWRGGVGVFVSPAKDHRGGGSARAERRPTGGAVVGERVFGFARTV